MELYKLDTRASCDILPLKKMAGQICASRDQRCADPGGGVGMAQHQLDLDRRRSIPHSEFIIEIVAVRIQGLKGFYPFAS
jgi:hypothetical protein